MVRVLALAAVLFLGSANVAQATVPPTVLAQYSTQTENGQSSSRTRVRPRGIIKLIGLGVVGVIAVGGFIAKKMRGGE